MTLTRKDLVEAVFEGHGGLSRREADEWVSILFECLKEGLNKNDKLVLSGFGSFEWRKVKPRSIQLPSGETMESHDRRKLWFRPSSKLKDRLNSMELQK